MPFEPRYDHKSALKLYFEEGWSQKEIAAHFGVRQQSVSYLVRREKAARRAQVVGTILDPLLDLAAAAAAQKRGDTQARNRSIFAARDKGARFSEIVRIVGLPSSSVANLLRVHRSTSSRQMPSRRRRHT